MLQVAACPAELRQLERCLTLATLHAVQRQLRAPATVPRLFLSRGPAVALQAGCCRHCVAAGRRQRALPPEAAGWLVGLAAGSWRLENLPLRWAMSPRQLHLMAHPQEVPQPRRCLALAQQPPDRSTGHCCKGHCCYLLQGFRRELPGCCPAPAHAAHKVRDTAASLLTVQCRTTHEHGVACPEFDSILPSEVLPGRGCNRKHAVVHSSHLLVRNLLHLVCTFSMLARLVLPDLQVHVMACCVLYTATKEACSIG